jgi:Helicase HerA, central domain
MHPPSEKRRAMSDPGFDFEKLGVLYLGRPRDPATARTAPSPFLYDSKDLTTHGLVVGMTGSGKTGLAIVLLEEAALDGIPAIVIDPKGDMANLALRFPDLKPEDFLPWIDPGEPLRRGSTPEDVARETASQWEQGIARWGQTKDRIRALVEAVEVAIYTPGSTAGRPLAALRGFEAPPSAVLSDEDALRERVTNAVSGLLGLVGIEADPVTSREHILLSSLLDRTWRAGEDATLESLLKSIESPPFERLGALDLESFFPGKDRFALVTKLNSLLASPAFAAWREGEPLDVQRLLYTASGKPRISVISIAHLGDEARMFIVTEILNEVISWMRGQQGTGSLRALLYMDEIFGFFPPVAAPPSKAPMLTLLKQARAFGLGVVLATQNPVDLDYKGLANIGTWFLGRLQTARDRERLLDGLASSAGGLDRKKTEDLLSSLDKRVFLMKNVHEDEPVLFETRWALSYLAGPLTLPQLKRIEASSSPGAGAPAPTPPRPSDPDPMRRTATSPPGESALDVSRDRLLVDPAIETGFLHSGTGPLAAYRPSILAVARLHFVKAGLDIDTWQTVSWLTPIDGLDGDPDWRRGAETAGPAVESSPRAGLGFASLPVAASRAKSYDVWKKSFQDYLYRERKLTLFECGSPEMTSRPGEAEADFRVRLAHGLREKRDQEREKLGAQYASDRARLEDAIRKAEARVDRESSQYSSSKMSTAVDFGMTLAGALFGRKLGSLSNASRASRTARSVSRASQERDDVVRAEGDLAAQKEKLASLDAEFAEKTRALAGTSGAEALPLEATSLAPRKADTRIDRFTLVWVAR